LFSGEKNSLHQVKDFSNAPSLSATPANRGKACKFWCGWPNGSA
jgi:hypothetical protein